MLKVTDDGDVTIGGTSSTNAKLFISSNSSTNPATITLNGDITNSTPDDDHISSSINMISDSISNGYGFNIDSLNGSSQSKTIFNHFKGGGKVQTIYIDHKERVGIGTNTTLTSLLHVTAKNAGTSSVFLVEKSNGADILRITEDGNSGFGTGTPQAKLHVKGTLRLENLPTSNSGLSTGDVWNDGGTLMIMN